MLVRHLYVLMAFTTLASGCGSSSKHTAASAPAASKTDVILTFDAERHACVVALIGEPQGSTIACADVVQFMRDELRLPSGSNYEIRTISHVDDVEMARVAANLKAAGYRHVGADEKH